MSSEYIRLRNSFSRLELDMLLCHAVRSMPVMRAAFGRMKVEQFIPDAEFVHQLVWATASEFYDAHKKGIPESAMRAILDKKKEDNPDYFGGNIYDNILATVIFIYGLPEQDLVPSYGIELVKRFIGERQIGVQFIGAAQSGVLQRQHLWEMLDTAQQLDALTPQPTILPFSSRSGPLLGVKPREPTGVTFLDVLMNGGPRKGELYGFLAPSGGGKTTLANQIAINYAMSGKHVMVFTYEQPPDAEYMIPIYACAAQADRNKFERIVNFNGDMSFLDEKERERFERMGKIIGENLHYRDMTAGSRYGADEIKALVEQEQQEAKVKVDAIIVDWFWPMVTRSYDRLELGRGKKKEVRGYAQDQIDRLKVICVELGVWGWLTHQLKPDAAKKNKIMDFEDAAELKSFAWYMNGCFCLSKMDDECLAPLKFSKARSHKSDHTIIKLLGNIATFVDAANMVFDPRQKKYVERGKENAVPKADKSDKSPTRTDYEGKVGAVRT